MYVGQIMAHIKLSSISFGISLDRDRASARTGLRDFDLVAVYVLYQMKPYCIYALLLLHMIGTEKVSNAGLVRNCSFTRLSLTKFSEYEQGYTLTQRQRLSNGWAVYNYMDYAARVRRNTVIAGRKCVSALLRCARERSGKRTLQCSGNATSLHSTRASKR